MALNSLISADVPLRIYPLTLPFGSPAILVFLCPDASTKKGGIPLTGAQKRGGCVFSLLVLQACSHNIVKFLKYFPLC